MFFFLNKNNILIYFERVFYQAVSPNIRTENITPLFTRTVKPVYKSSTLEV